MKYIDAIDAVQDAERTLQAADVIVRHTGHLMIGRLKQMNATHLAKLKKELRDFNSVTGQWKT